MLLFGELISALPPGQGSEDENESPLVILDREITLPCCRRKGNSQHVASKTRQIWRRQWPEVRYD
jgi:hypothetical protein